MHATYTEKDFQRLSWHDNHIYGLRLAIGDIGFTQVLRAEPSLIDEQKLNPAQRPPP